MADISWTGIAAAYVGGAATPAEGMVMFSNALGMLWINIIGSNH